MFENRRYQGVIARAGRGRHSLTSRRVIEVNLLIIGALIFVGIGIASLPSDAGRNITQNSPQQKNARLSGGDTGAPGSSENTLKILIATLLRRDGILVRTAVLEVAPPNRTMTHAATLVAARQMLHTTARPARDAGIPSSNKNTRWVRAPHPLAVPLPLVQDRAAYRIAAASVATTDDLADDPQAPMVRLDTRTRESRFWYVVAGISLVTFASGFWNSRRAHKHRHRHNT